MGESRRKGTGTESEVHHNGAAVGTRRTQSGRLKSSHPDGSPTICRPEKFFSYPTGERNFYGRKSKGGNWNLLKRFITAAQRLERGAKRLKSSHPDQSCEWLHSQIISAAGASHFSRMQCGGLPDGRRS